MSNKILLVAFNGEIMCFVHVLLNALDMADKGHDVKVVIEGSATRAAAELGEGGKPFAELFAGVVEKGLVDCVCHACAAKMGVLEKIEALKLPLRGDMKGHPALAGYIEDGYQIITF